MRSSRLAERWARMGLKVIDGHGDECETCYLLRRHRQRLERLGLYAEVTQVEADLLMRMARR